MPKISKSPNLARSGDKRRTDATKFIYHFFLMKKKENLTHRSVGTLEVLKFYEILL